MIATNLALRFVFELAGLATLAFAGFQGVEGPALLAVIRNQATGPELAR